MVHSQAAPSASTSWTFFSRFPPADWILPPLRVVREDTTKFVFANGPPCHRTNSTVCARRNDSGRGIWVSPIARIEILILRWWPFSFANSYLITIPAEYRFYKSQQHYGRIAYDKFRIFWRHINACLFIVFPASFSSSFGEYHNR